MASVWKRSLGFGALDQGDQRQAHLCLCHSSPALFEGANSCWTAVLVRFTSVSCVRYAHRSRPIRFTPLHHFAGINVTAATVTFCIVAASPLGRVALFTIQEFCNYLQLSLSDFSPSRFSAYCESRRCQPDTGICCGLRTAFAGETTTHPELLVAVPTISGVRRTSRLLPWHKCCTCKAAVRFISATP